MGIQKKRWQLAAVLVVTGLAAACGHPLSQPLALGVRAVQLTPEGEVIPVKASVFPLSEAQKRQLQAVLEQNKDVITLIQTQHAKIYDLLQEEEVDQARLVQAMSDHVAKVRQHIPQLVAMIGQVRAVMTPEQREALVRFIADRLADQLVTADQRELGELIGYSAEQNRLVAALGMEEIYKGMLKAYLAFFETGDQQALANTLGMAFDLTDAARLATALASLPLDKRQQLIRIGQRRDQLLMSGLGS